MDKAIDDDMDDAGAGGGGGSKFNLSEAMMNKKHLNKCRDEVKKMKQVMTELQQYVQQHQLLINRELVNEDKLKITAELLDE